MLKTKKAIFGTILCTLTALCLTLGMVFINKPVTTFASGTTIANVLETNENFPTTEATAWVADNGNIAYKNTAMSKLTFYNGINTLSYGLDLYVTSSGDNYVYNNITFVMTDGVLSSITVDHQETSYNGTYHAKPTIADFLPDDFPTSDDGTTPSNAWASADGNQVFVNTMTNNLTVNASSIEFALTQPLNKVSDTKYSFEGWLATIHLVLDDGDLFSIEIEGSMMYVHANGVYTVPCSVNVTAGDNGSIASVFNTISSPSYSKKIGKGTAYTVDGNKLTIGSAEITATASEGYDFDCWEIGEIAVTANGTVTEDTAFKAIFTEKEIESESETESETETETESETQSESASESTSENESGTEVEPTDDDGLSAGAIVGICLGSVFGACLIAYIAMYIVWRKKAKGLKFLIKSFEWIDKLFTK